MNVLHYSISLSACPKCHLFICKHTSLAGFDLNLVPQKQEQQPNDQLAIDNTNKNSSSQQHCLPGTNVYIFPSVTNDENNRHSWTTFGTESNETTNIFSNMSTNNEAPFDNIPFANENLTSSLSSSTLNHIVQTSSDKNDEKSQKSICLTKSLSLSTVDKKSSLSPSIKRTSHSFEKSYSYSSRTWPFILLLILSFIMTNTIDIVLLYIYYHASQTYFIGLIIIIVLIETILWINNLIQLCHTRSCLLSIPFISRPYLLYELVEFLTIAFNKNRTVRILNSSLSSSLSTTTTTTCEKNALHKKDPSTINYVSFYKMKKQQLFGHLTLFYHIHTGLITLMNIYFWLNHIPQWTFNHHHSNQSSDIEQVQRNQHIQISFYNFISSHWQIFEHERKHMNHQNLVSNWTQLLFSPFIPMPTRFSSSSTFIFVSILYHLTVNYSIFSTILILQRFSFDIILSILSRLCLIIPRLFTFVFLIQFNIWWLFLCFLLLHTIIMITRLFYRSYFKQQRNTMFLQIVFSFITHDSADDIPISALISLENLSVFLCRLYLTTVSSGSNETRLWLIIFISILMSLQIVGFIFDILSKHAFYRTKPIVIL